MLEGFKAEVIFLKLEEQNSKIKVVALTDTALVFVTSHTDLQITKEPEIMSDFSLYRFYRF